MQHNNPFEETNRLVFWISVALFAAATAGLIFAALTDHSTWAAIANALSSSILAVAIVSLSYEWFLRKSISRELLRLVGIERTVAANNVAWMGRLSDFDWRSFFEGERALLAVGTESGETVKANWDVIRANCADGPITIEVALPDPRGPNANVVADSLERDYLGLSTWIDEQRQSLETMWKRARQENVLHANSRFKVVYFEPFPSYRILIAGRKVLVTISGLAAPRIGESGFAILFSGSPNDFPLNWFVREASELLEEPPEFENEVSP